MRRLLVLCTITLALWAGAGTAWAARFVLLAPDSDAAYGEAADALVQELQRSGVSRGDVLRFAPQEPASATAVDSADGMVITLGADALMAALLRRPAAPVLASLIPRATYERVLAETGPRSGNPVHAVFLDQPAGRQLDLLHMALPDVERVGVLWSRDAQALVTSIQMAARSRGLQIVAPRVAARGEERAPLAQVLAEAQVLLALPDPVVYHSGSIANLLLATYRAGVPMLGFSPSYVRAGALLALYSSPRQIGVQTAQRAAALLASSPASATTVYPVDFSVEVNTHVARSLGRNLDAAELTERLRQQERRP